MNYIGMLIRKERKQRGWSQESLCNGICAVSYLSKIEQGQIIPSSQIQELLLNKMGLICNEALEQQAHLIATKLYDLLFSGQFSKFETEAKEIQLEPYRACVNWLDLYLLHELTKNHPTSLPHNLEVCMNDKQLALQFILQGSYEQALHQYPCAYTNFELGKHIYENGHNYVSAITHLQKAYDLACEKGYVYLMLEAKLFIGNCYSNMLDLDNMMQTYDTCLNIAQIGSLTSQIESIYYNIASTQIECGQYLEAYQYFKKLKHPDMLSLHKLAICEEKLGKKEKAMQTIAKAKQAFNHSKQGNKTTLLMCQVVEYRLTHPNYLKEKQYGSLIQECFECCQKELPIGYASFHLPWLLEWYRATRQYQKAYQLLSDFPIKYHKMPF